MHHFTFWTWSFRDSIEHDFVRIWKSEIGCGQLWVQFPLETRLGIGLLTSNNLLHQVKPTGSNFFFAFVKYCDANTAISTNFALTLKKLAFVSLRVTCCIMHFVSNVGILYNFNHLKLNWKHMYQLNQL